jgi:hypothetical protein
MSLTPASDSLRADHRRIEVHLDALLAALLQFSADRLPEVRRRFLEIRALAAPHFEKEETVVYPHLRPSLPELLVRMDEQHAHIHEVEHYLAELLGGLADLPACGSPTPSFPRRSSSGCPDRCRRSGLNWTHERPRTHRPDHAPQGAGSRPGDVPAFYWSLQPERRV